MYKGISVLNNYFRLFITNHLKMLLLRAFIFKHFVIYVLPFIFSVENNQDGLSRSFEHEVSLKNRFVMYLYQQNTLNGWLIVGYL